MPFLRYFRRAKWDRERRQELDFYLQLETEDNLARGMPLEQAREAASRKLGNRTVIREEIYRMNTIGIVDTLSRDVRFGLRMLRHNPTFTVVALLTLAIGIGANTAVFSVVNSVLLKPLSYPHPEELVAIWQKAPGAEGLTSVSGGLRLSGSMFFTYSEENKTFQSMGAWLPNTATVTGLAEPEQVRIVLLTQGTLEALGTQVAHGRALSLADQQPASPPVVMLGYGYWQRRFGGDPSVIGRVLTVDARSREIVGIMPRGFKLGNTDPELLVPTQLDRSRQILAGFGFQGVARLKPGITIAQANADLARLVPVWMNSWSNGPGTNSRVYESWRIGPAIRPLKDDVIGNVSRVLWVLMATIGIVMLIACANVANLLLVRADARQQELAVRAALGAGWGRIVRELLLESVLLGMLGGVLGLGLAYAALRVIVRLGPGTLPRLDEIALDPRALGFTVVISLFSGLLFGLIPALKYAAPRISLGLRSGGRGLSQSRERHRARNVLVVAQVALALVLLIGSGLMIRTFQALRTVDPGFSRPEQIQTIRVAIPGLLVPNPVQVARIQNDLLDKIAAIPGVTSVGYASIIPMDDSLPPNWDGINIEGKVLQPDATPPMRLFKSISPGLFQTLGTRMIAGRDLTWNEFHERRPVVLLSENLARELWNDPQAAVGKRVRTSPRSPWREVIGVVQDVHANGVHEPAPATVYWPGSVESMYGPGNPNTIRAVTIAIRSNRTNTEAFLSQVRQAIWSVNASLPVASVQTMQDIYSQSMARTSFTLVMLALAGSMALLLGLVGIYGVISYAVSQRSREIGIRLALGAQQGEMRKMFVSQALMLAGIGVVIGLGAAMGVTRLMSSLLFGVSPLDLPTYASVPFVLVAAAMVASYLPARRASAVNPADALRAE